MARLDAGVPTSPLVDATGYIRPEWRAFLSALWIRTGGAVGQSTDTTQLEAQLAAEEAARVQGDNTLGNALAAEVVARAGADTAEARTRQAADYTLSIQIQQETTARIAGDLLMVPKSQQCTLWAQCNLSFLPTSDPGHGQPWLNGTVLTVGTAPGALVGIGLEDASGDWTLEDGSGHWQYG